MPYIEDSLESHTGWQPGDRARFDSALFNDDLDTIHAMIHSGNVPFDYLQRFQSRITNLEDQITPMPEDTNNIDDDFGDGPEPVAYDDDFGTDD